jgi:hypothetical protein
VGASFSLSESEEGSGPSGCKGSVGSDGVGGGAIVNWCRHHAAHDRRRVLVKGSSDTWGYSLDD